MKKILLLLLTLLFWLILFPPRTQAASEGIFFNEIAWRGSSISTADEWLELYNDSDKVVDLSGWQLYDQVADKTMVAIVEGQIAPRGNFLISNNAKDYKFSKGESTLNVDPDLVDSAVSLSNDKFKLSLRNGLGEDIDVAGDGKAPFFGENLGQIASMKRADFSISGDLLAAWQASVDQQNLDPTATDFGSPASSGRPKITSAELKSKFLDLNESFSNQIVYTYVDAGNDAAEIKVILYDSAGDIFGQSDLDSTGQFAFPKLDFCPIVKLKIADVTGLWTEKSLVLTCGKISKSLRFSEIMPHPGSVDFNGDGTANTDDEFIEIKNTSPDKIDLAGYYLSDFSGKIYKFSSSQTIEDLLVVFKNQTAISINDTGEILSLFDPLGNLLDRVEVPSSSSRTDQSYSLGDSNWVWSHLPTPGVANQFDKVAATPTTDSQSPVATTPSPAASVVAKAPATKGRIITVKTKTKLVSGVPTKIRRTKVSGVVLSSQEKPKTIPSKVAHYLLYFTGLLIIIILIYSNEIYRRE